MRSYSALVEKEPCRVECSALFYRAIAPIRSPEYYLAITTLPGVHGSGAPGSGLGPDEFVIQGTTLAR